MTRRSLNVWRVYLDLFMNLTGIIALGGAGMMIMVGGAAPEAAPGPSAYATSCEGWDSIGRWRGENRPEGHRDEFANLESCTLEFHYRDVLFDTQGYDKPNDDTAADSFCEDLIDALLRIRMVKGAQITVVGQTSAKFDRPENCRFSPEEDPAPNGMSPVAGQNPRREGVREYMCNSDLGASRALSIMNRCLARLDPHDVETTGLFMDRVRVTTPNQAERDALRQHVKGDQKSRDHDVQTVTLRVELPIHGYNVITPDPLE